MKAAWPGVQCEGSGPGVQCEGSGSGVQCEGSVAKTDCSEKARKALADLIRDPVIQLFGFLTKTLGGHGCGGVWGTDRTQKL